MSNKINLEMSSLCRTVRAPPRAPVGGRIRNFIRIRALISLRTPKVNINCKLSNRSRLIIIIGRFRWRHRKYFREKLPIATWVMGQGRVCKIMILQQLSGLLEKIEKKLSLINIIFQVNFPNIIQWQQNVAKQESNQSTVKTLM